MSIFVPAHGLAAVAIVALARPVSADLILNGSFEINALAVSTHNLSNPQFTSVMGHATGFGARATGDGIGELDVMTFGGGFGLDPVDGQWHVALAGGGVLEGQEEPDAFSLALAESIVPGASYDLGFWAAANGAFNQGTQDVEIGISSVADEFGTLVYSTGSLKLDHWNEYATTFVAPVAGSFLTVRVRDTTPQDPLATWAHVDDFRLVAVPAPSALAVFALGAGLTRRRRREERASRNASARPAHGPG